MRWRTSGETAEVFSAREGSAASTLHWASSKLGREKAAAALVQMVQLVRVLAAPRSTWWPRGRGFAFMYDRPALRKAALSIASFLKR